jgi:hypothetical protein
MVVVFMTDAPSTLKSLNCLVGQIDLPGKAEPSTLGPPVSPVATCLPEVQLALMLQWVTASVSYDQK